MGILLHNFKLMKDQLGGDLEDLRRKIVEGQEPINYLLENPDDLRMAFKGKFQHLFQDENLLIATTLYLPFSSSEWLGTPVGT